MGTRGAYGVFSDGQLKLTYNHFDSYPTGLGKELANQLGSLITKYSHEALKGLAAAVTLVDEHSKPTKVQIAKCKDFTDLTVSSQKETDWYCLLRGLQGNLVDALVKVGLMTNANDFPRDSLFCEWAYVANFDDMTLEVYKGFQRKTHKKGRFADPECKSEYKPVKLVKTFKLDKPIAGEFAKWAEKVDG